MPAARAAAGGDNIKPYHVALVGEASVVATLAVARLRLVEVAAYLLFKVREVAVEFSMQIFFSACLYIFATMESAAMLLCHPGDR
jgi:hypothetical protein